MIRLLTPKEIKMSSKHDTWIELKSEAYLDRISEFFPEGIPMRDPFPMFFFPLEETEKSISLWVTDNSRFSPQQIEGLAYLIAEKNQKTSAEDFRAFFEQQKKTSSKAIAFPHLCPKTTLSVDFRLKTPQLKQDYEKKFEN